MSVLRLSRRLFRLATGRPGDGAEVEAELALHLELLTEELAASGLPLEQARREAERRFGNSRELSRTIRRIDSQMHRDTRRRETMQRIARDLRIAARTLLRQPLFALGGVLIVALGIGASTAMFTVLNAAFLRPFPYPDADRLMMVYEIPRSGGRMPVAGPNAIDWTAEIRLFSALGYYANGEAVLSSGGESRFVRGATASRGFAAVLGLAPLAGRWFTEDEARVGGPPVVVLSEALWRRRFDGDRSIVGRAIQLDGSPVTVVGIMPATFAYPVTAELWRPAEPYNTGISRTAHNWRVVARLAPGVTAETAGRELSALTRRLMADQKGGDEFVAAGAAVLPFREQLIGDSRKVLILLQGAVLLVLLIAAVNLTNLTLARAVRRQGEVGVCLALGARRGDVIRRFASENLLITLVGGGAGVALAALLRGLLGRWVGKMLPFVKELPLDLTVAGFALILALGVGLASSLVPAWRAGGGAIGLMGSRGGTATRSSRRLIHTLMGAEVALAVILVSGAGLVSRSLVLLSGVDPGFSVADRAVASVLLRMKPSEGSPVYDRLLAELRALPGTRSAALSSTLPLWTGSPNGSAQVEGAPSARGGPPATSDFRIVSPDYFRALEIPVRKGREFLESDVVGSPFVAVVNDAFVRKYLEGSDPLTRRVRFPGMDSSDDPWAAVVGVVADTRQDGLATEPVPAIYYSYRQRPSWRALTVVVHSTLPTGRVLDDLKERLARIDPAMPFSGRVWSDLVRDSLALPRIRSVLLALFAGIALLLSAVGIGAVVAFAVAQRTREIGLRIAVGAPPAALTREGVLRAARPMLAGVVIGLIGAVALGRLARSLLFGLAPSDPPTLAAAALVTVMIALLAAYLPARRAVKVDPLTALRAE